MALTTNPAPPEWGFPDGTTVNPDGSVTLPDGTMQPGPASRTLTARGNPNGQGPTAQQAAHGADPTAPGYADTVATGDAGLIMRSAPAAGSGGPSGGSNLTDPFTQTYQAPQPLAMPGAPSYTAPVFTPPSYTAPPAFAFPDFKAPSVADALNDPGYQFRTQQGEQQLAASAAAKGVLNSGGTLKDVVDYGQNAASQEYANVWNRDYNAYGLNRSNAVGTYNTNYQTQYQDPYAIAFGGASAAFAPQMAGFQANVGAGNLAYSTTAANTQHQNDVNYQTAWDKWLQQWNIFKDQRDSTFDKNFKVATA